MLRAATETDVSRLTATRDGARIVLRWATSVPGILGFNVYPLDSNRPLNRSLIAATPAKNIYSFKATGAWKALRLEVLMVGGSRTSYVVSTS